MIGKNGERESGKSWLVERLDDDDDDDDDDYYFSLSRPASGPGVDNYGWLHNSSKKQLL